MAFKHFKALVYVQVEEPEEDVMEEIDVKDYCLSAVRLDLDTEEHGNPCGVTKVEIDWDTLTTAPELDK